MLTGVAVIVVVLIFMTGRFTCRVAHFSVRSVAVIEECDFHLTATVTQEPAVHSKHLPHQHQRGGAKQECVSKVQVHRRTY